MKLILCDDMQCDLLQLKEMIRQYLMGKGIQFQIITYTDIVELEFNLLEIGDFSVFFLDIDLPSGNGVDLARRILDEYPHSLCFFYTAHKEYAIEGYRSGARRYILKNESEGVVEALNYAIRQLEENKNYVFRIKLEGEYVYLNKEGILYVNSNGHYLDIYMNTGKVYHIKSGIKEFYELLNYGRLLFIDRSVFINIDYVKQICKEEVMLINNTKLPISRRRGGDVIEHILKERFG